jgi:hypothetical protein
MRQMPCLSAGLALLAVLAAQGLAAEKKAEKKTVIPFDFESRFDDGRYGAIVGEMIWKKLSGEARFVVPESMQDVRGVCEQLKFRPRPATSLADMKKIVREEFEGDIAIWGAIERVPPHEFDVYELTIRAVDFSGEKPVVLFDESHRTESVSEVPHVHVKNLLARLSGRDLSETPAAAAQKPGVPTGPNLVTNGAFEKGESSPAGWDPLPASVELVGGKETHFLKMSLSEEVAGTTGVLYYSDFFPVETGKTYRFTCRYRTSGPAVKVFVKCYDEFRAREGKKTEPAQRREVYRSQQNLKGSAGEWHTHTEDFTPKHPQFTPKWGRVMLYAYWPAGIVEWDDIEVRPLELSDKKTTGTKR